MGFRYLFAGVQTRLLIRRRKIQQASYFRICLDTRREQGSQFSTATRHLQAFVVNHEQYRLRCRVYTTGSDTPRFLYSRRLARAKIWKALFELRLIGRPHHRDSRN